MIDVADATVDAVMGELPSFETVVGRRRVRTPLIPEAVLREAILNGLAHRDYGLENATVDVTMTDETVSVQSPGPLPGHVTVDNIRDEHYSRNPRLMTVLKAALVVEEFGDGVDRMFDQMAERLLPEPEYVAASSSVTVTLRATSALPIEDQAWLGMFSDLDLDRDDRRVLLLVRRDGAATRRAVRALEPTREAASILRSMVDRGFLEPKGTRGGKHYVLSDEIRTRVGDSGIEAQRARRERVVSELRRAGTAGVSTREAATMLGDDDLRAARTILNELVHDGQAVGHGRTSGRRYYSES